MCMPYKHWTNNTNYSWLHLSQHSIKRWSGFATNGTQFWRCITDTLFGNGSQQNTSQLVAGGGRSSWGWFLGFWNDGRPAGLLFTLHRGPLLTFDGSLIHNAKTGSLSHRPPIPTYSTTTTTTTVPSQPPSHPYPLKKGGWGGQGHDDALEAKL